MQTMTTMKSFLERNLPPGYSYKAELYTVIFAFSWVTLSSFVRFLNTFSRQRQMLFFRTGGGMGGEMTLIEGAIMPDFVNILGNNLLQHVIFGILAFIFASAIHYAYYRADSKSIYLMRRLPNSFELHRRCLLLPALYAVDFLLMGAVLLFIYYAIYMISTPEAALMPGQWQRLWSVFR